MTYQDISILSIALIITFSGLFINLFKKGGGSTIKFQQDGKTLLLFRLVVPAVLIASVLIYFFGPGHFSRFEKLIYAGYVFAVLGLLIRWIAVYSLGEAFKVKVTILNNQKLNTAGIYKTIRHPSYTGLLMYYLGLGLLMQNWICLLLLTLAPVFVVLQRIALEEVVLNEHFGVEYKTYSLKTWKLIPYLF